MNRIDSKTVYSLVRKVPAGKVSTYGEIARACGKSGGARAVGNILAANEHPFFRPRHSLSVPCHRIVMADGRIGGFNGGLARKIRLLRAEGVAVRAGRVQKFGQKLFVFNLESARKPLNT